MSRSRSRGYFKKLEKSFHECGQVTYLTQKDFEEGTYRIQHSGLYVFKEDVSFEPNPDHDWMPRPDQEKYQHPAYSLGFFAAVTVECENVIIDLKGHTLKQSPVFALQQRFYANIELANTPFIPGQGPGNFGSFTGSAKNCLIKNGYLGLSSHHGIHGNNVENLLFRNLTIHDFEVAGAAVNGFDGWKLSYMKIGPNRRDVPVNSGYSAGRFLHFVGRSWLQTHSENLSQEIQTLANIALTTLEQSLDEVLTAVQNNQPVPETNFFAMAPHSDGERLPDGNNYGLLAHVPGVAIADYIEENTEAKLSKDLSVESVKICQIKAKVAEVVALVTPDGKVLNDLSGSVFRILDAVDQFNEVGGPHPDAKYKANVLADAQIALAKAALSIGEPIGRSNLTQAVVDWAESGAAFQTLLDLRYQIGGNGDSMSHVQKGVHGGRLDGLEHAHFHDFRIEDISNVGHLGSLAAGKYEKSHPAQKRNGYTGADSVGLSLSYVHNIKGHDIQIKHVHSDNSTARGIRFINESTDVDIHGGSIEDITTGYLYEDGCWYGTDSQGEKVLFSSCLPNLVPCAYGVCIEIYDDEPSKHIHLPGLKIRKVHGACNLSMEYAWLTIYDVRPKEEPEVEEKEEEETEEEEDIQEEKKEEEEHKEEKKEESSEVRDYCCADCGDDCQCGSNCRCGTSS